MDDYDVNIVTQSKNEWSWKIVTLLTPFMIEGITAIFNDAYELSDENLYAYNVYQIEGLGKSLFLKIEGDKDTIMGLPVKKIKEYLKNFN